MRCGPRTCPSRATSPTRPRRSPRNSAAAEEPRLDAAKAGGAPRRLREKIQASQVHSEAKQRTRGEALFRLAPAAPRRGSWQGIVPPAGGGKSEVLRSEKATG